MNLGPGTLARTGAFVIMNALEIALATTQGPYGREILIRFWKAPCGILQGT